ncbi:site-specific integrase [Streptomyces sp. Z26]|uniref:tyrosine-type recombinase/integrase n=1 Tax=Streptomyces sp. Z26 TaxID=2500177 RepID=UPI000EF14B4E|nr:site-specific integrase [Streptomyces sp. Z26]RLL66955.1 site-specific integrase [Streptomyces sp. Z26]
MAYITERPQRNGSVTYQVRWIEGGGRVGEKADEKFADRTDAETFKTLVNAHGQRWPPGWIRGQGFVEAPEHPDDVPLLPWCHRYVNRLTGVDERTRDDYRRDIDRHLALIQHTRHSGQAVEPTIGNITADDVQDWVRLQEKGEENPETPGKWIRRPASPKSIANRHGLLWCIVQAALESEPQRRTKNCCVGTRLPRTDDGVDAEMVFLEQDEYQRVRVEFTDPGALDLADWLVGTGMRWGEATALQVRDLKLSADNPTASVERAWKRAPKGSTKSFFLGPPKTRKARRLVGLSGAQVDMARRLVTGQPPEAAVFRTAWGNAWAHGNFYNRKWRPAVEAAVAAGLPRRPRIHDLRHTHVSWLIAANIPLPAIQARLGHESIQTTVDRYGHLVRTLDAEISAAVEAAMSPVARHLHAVRDGEERGA